MTAATAVAKDAPRQEVGRLLVWALGLTLLVRLVTLGLYPLTDTTESRYAEIARKMAELGDWVTPWYAPGVPFWAKPPLSIWATAGSMRLLGVNEWAARLPHCLAALLVAALVWDWMCLRSRREALLALALLGGSALYFVSAGAVMTDMLLLLGLMLAMRGFWLGLHADRHRRREQWLFFIGLALGLLAKGPVALVLAGLPIGVWVLSTGSLRVVWRGLPWLRGTLLMLMLALPWYLLAEHRTPGFLRYFIVGEHWDRFTVPGWSGDRYGSAHHRPHGMIWLFALVAFMPWTLLLPLSAIGRKGAAAARAAAVDRSWRNYLLFWALTPCVFFTLSGNILWTYVLPGLPALAMLVAAWLARDGRLGRTDGILTLGLLLTCGLFVGGLGALQVRGDFGSAKAVIAALQARGVGGQQLTVVGSEAYSAIFYTRGQVQTLDSVVDLNVLLHRGPRSPDQPERFVALLAPQWRMLPPDARALLQPQGRFDRYLLYSVRR